jgi:adenosylhomocysteine nucleosidase
MSGVLVVMALPEEGGARLEAAGAAVLYTGVGKVNASHALTRRLLEIRHAGTPLPRILNLGTAGSPRWPPGTVLACDRFVQRDMDARALGFPLGATPFDPTPAELRFATELPELPAGRCASGDSFVTEAADLDADVFDMEAFALARVCLFEGARFACAKFVTDGADDGAAGDWSAALDTAAEALLAVYRRYAAAV